MREDLVSRFVTKENKTRAASNAKATANRVALGQPVLTKLYARLWAVRRAILLYLAVLVAGWAVGEYVLDMTIPEIPQMDEPVIQKMVFGAVVVFVLAAAIPFVPGAEVGFALLLIFGAQAALIVYVGMVGALLLSFGVARIVPMPVLSRLAHWLGLKRAAGLVDESANIPRSQRADVISHKLQGQFGKMMLKNRYVLLAVLLNMPGNTLLGGGGGLAFLAGNSGLYRPWPYLVTVLIAVAPFPLLFVLIGR